MNRCKICMSQVEPSSYALGPLLKKLCINCRTKLLADDDDSELENETADTLTPELDRKIRLVDYDDSSLEEAPVVENHEPDVVVNGFICDYCLKRLNTRCSLYNHIKVCSKNVTANPKPFQCPVCEKKFARKQHLVDHGLSNACKRAVEKRSSDSVVSGAKRQKKVVIKYCENCDISFNEVEWKKHLSTPEHIRKALTAISSITSKISGIFGGRISRFRIVNPDITNLAFIDFFTNSFVMKDILDLLQKHLHQHQAVKIQLKLCCDYVKPTISNDQDGERIAVETKSFYTNFTELTLTEHDNLAHHLTVAFDTLIHKAMEFEQKDSGWALAKISHLELNINKYEPLKGLGFIDLPAGIKKKEACINTTRDDDRCFQWAIRAALFDAKETPVLKDREDEIKNSCDCESEKTKKLKSLENVHYHQLVKMNRENAETIDRAYDLNWTDPTTNEEFAFPMDLLKIKRFEQTNQHISVNVFGVGDDGLTIEGPLYKRSNKNRRIHINLLFFDNGTTFHFCWIKNLGRLVNSQINIRGHKKFICNDCLCIFHSQEKLEEHGKRDCLAVVCTFPKTSVEFDAFNKQLETPFVVYADSEALLVPVKGADNDPEKSCKSLIFVYE